MLTPITVTARDILRNYKQVFKDVKNTRRPAVVIFQKKPQVGIVSLEDIERLKELDQQIKYQQSTKSLLEVAGKIRDLLKKEHLPKDLSARHDYYLYEEVKNK